MLPAYETTTHEFYILTIMTTTTIITKLLSAFEAALRGYQTQTKIINFNWHLTTTYIFNSTEEHQQ